MNTDSIQYMTRQEKLQTMEALWDALTRDTSEPASPAWHGEVLAERRARMEQSNATFVSLDELKSEPHK